MANDRSDVPTRGRGIGNARQVQVSHSELEYLALTSARLDGAEMHSYGLATHFVHSLVGSIIERPGVVPVHNSRWPTSGKSYKLVSSPAKRYLTVVSSAKTSEATVAAKSEESTAESSIEEKTPRTATFPSGFEALVLEVCDETQIAELKLKVGDFEMLVRRNVGAPTAPLANISPTTPPPIPSKPMEESAPVAPPPSPPKPASEKSTPFTNVSFGKSSKLAALEASGSNAYVLVSSPTVGSFRRNRTVKGKKQPPICKEGDVIKEGQVIGYLDQFGTELPVKSDVAGEVLKLLFDDGDAVGFGDPLIAVLPSFHDIQ